ncbi:MAG: hypothetical protein Q8O30_03290 [Candidatus Omnitrophota bacterium]|nr:hypothetical protein [Candidatus Omnitrophota bacterium]
MSLGQRAMVWPHLAKAIKLLGIPSTSLRTNAEHSRMHSKDGELVEPFVRGIGKDTSTLLKKIIPRGN